MKQVVRLDAETVRLAKAGWADVDRDESGRWSSGGGSGGDKDEGGGGASPTTHPGDAQYHNEKDGKYHVKGDVDAAVRLIGEGKDVVLEQPRELSTLVQKLAAIGKSGEKKVYDLCRVSVSGTNLFCAESAGYARVDMPQLSGHATPGSIADTTLPHDRKGGVDATPKFIEALEAKGYSVKATTEDAGYLRATQRELDGAKVAGMMQAMQEGKIIDEALVVSKDNYIIDGHHRWAAKVALAYSAQVTMDMPILKVDIPVIPLVEEAKAFANEIGIPQRGVGKSLPARTGGCGCATPCGCGPHVVVRLDADSLRGALRPGVVYARGWEDVDRDDAGRWASGGGGSDDSGGDSSSGSEASARNPGVPADPKVQAGVLPAVPEKVVANAEAALAADGYPVEVMRANATGLMEYAKANPEVWAEGMAWYEREHEFANELAARGNITNDSSAALLAAVSPRQSVEVSEDQARAVVDAMNADGTVEVTPESIEANYQRLIAAYPNKPALIEKAKEQRDRALREDVGSHDVIAGDPTIVSRWHENRHAVLTANWQKGLRITRGELPEDVLSGPKVWSFYDNIRSPETSQSVTIDTWMVRALTKFDATEDDIRGLLGNTPKGPKSTGRYEAFSRRVRESATRYNVTPLQAQAIMWTAIREQAANP